MAEFRKILISGANAEVNAVYVSNMTSTVSDYQVVVRNPSTGQLFITGTYSNAGTPPTFSGEYNGNIDLTVDPSATDTRYVAIGTGRTVDGNSDLEFYSQNDAGVSLAIRRQEGDTGSSSFQHYGTNDVVFRLMDGSTNSFIFRNSNGDNLFRIRANGSIFANNIRQAATSYVLYYNPTSKEITYAAGGSTKKIKNNIQDLDKSWVDNFDKLRPVTFNYKYKPGEDFGGFIAEELEKIHPALVHYGPNYKIGENGNLNRNEDPIDDQLVPENIKDRSILALIVAKIQELDKKIEELKKLKQNGPI